MYGIKKGRKKDRGRMDECMVWYKKGRKEKRIGNE